MSKNGKRLSASANATASSKITISGIDIPQFSRIKNLGVNSYGSLARRIDDLGAVDIEWAKIPLLMADENYIEFLVKVTNSSAKEVKSALQDFSNDDHFRRRFESNLRILSQLADVGDLRFHGISLYVFVRITKPQFIIETGVAHGKSSSLMLLALEHNDYGKLTSIDIPAGGIRADGSSTSLHERQIGWIIPEYLKSRWQLIIGNSLVELPPALESLQGELSMFFHDSLHTAEHTTEELRLVEQYLGSNSLICVDNINLGSGFAFQSFLEDNELDGFAFRDFAATQFKKDQRPLVQ